MKTIEDQLDDMLPEDFKRRRRLAASRTAHIESIAACLRKLGRAGVTVEQAARNINAAVAEARKQDIM